MEKFLFADGESICLYKDGEVIKRPSKFIENYKSVALNTERARSWKHSGEGAEFRGDLRYTEEESSFNSRITGVWFTESENEVAYAFSINTSSGIYKIDLSNEKVAEAHVINSVDYSFAGGCLDATAGLLATSMSRNFCNSDIALFDMKSGDYKLLTDGDTEDEDPFISPDDGNIIYFSSRGVGRSASGEFVSFSPAALCKLNVSALEVEEIAVSDKYSYFKPVMYNGKLYAIKAPAKEKSPNPLLEIILIPFRIIQAVANFINTFVRAFTGKSLASGGSNPAKGREYDSRKEFVRGNLINAEKEMKRNARKDKSDYGFIPLSWQLIEVESGNVIKSGVGDYDIAADGTFIVTNGKRIFAIKDKKCEKLLNVERCLRVSCKHNSNKKSDLFDF